MIVGYITGSDEVVCAACWRREGRRAATADRVLDADSREGPDDQFWIVDTCAGCGAVVRYRDATLVQ